MCKVRVNLCFKLEVIAMKDKHSLHLKVQELCDCFATTDPLKEMSLLEKDAEGSGAALKWLALAILHGINARPYFPAPNTSGR